MAIVLYIQREGYMQADQIKQLTFFVFDDDDDDDDEPLSLLPAPDVDPAVDLESSSPPPPPLTKPTVITPCHSFERHSLPPGRPRRRKTAKENATRQSWNMSSPDDQLVKRARMLRHAQRDVPNAIKARFSPTAIWTTVSQAEPSVPTIPVAGPKHATKASVLTTPSAVIPTIPATTSIPTTPALVATTAPITPSTTSTSTSVIQTSTSTTSTSSIPAITSAAPTSTSTTSSSLLIPTTTTPSSSLTTSSQTTAFVTKTLSTTNAVASASGSALDSASTPSSSSSSGISTAGIIGIAAAGIVGAAVLAGITMFFLRRWNRREDESNPDDFRRQSVIMRDDNSSLHRGNSGGRGPRPPTMFERHNQNIATFVASPMPPTNAYPQPVHSYGSPSPFSDFAASQASPSFAPGMYVPTSTVTPGQPGQYANAPPFFNPSFQSPVGSPVTIASYGGAAIDAQGRLMRAPSNAAASVLSRNNSVAHSQYPADESDYADLNRASVTPFQAAQYEAISKQLNIAPPMALHQVTEDEEVEESQHMSRQILPVSEVDPKPSLDVSPFDDPRVGSVQSNSSALADDNVDQFNPSRPSSEFHAMNPFTLPVGPSPRVASQPPSLPEIQVVNGSFSPVTYSFPVTPSPGKGSFDVQSGRASPKVDMPPLSPVATSPQRAQFVNGSETHAHDGRETPVEIGFVADSASASKTDLQTPAQAKIQTPKRPETVYDDEDAYGGI